MTADDKMSINERYQYLRRIQGRYRQATRQAKTAVLDEIVAHTGMHRKSVIRRLNGSLERQPRRGTRGPEYGADFDTAMAVIWKSTAYAYLLDIYPTLSDLVGIAIPDSVEGKSLHEVLEDPSTTRRETLLFAYRGFQRAVQDRRYKLIEYVVNGERNTQLFDLAQDPWELHSLAGEPAYQTKVSELRRELRRWQTELGDSRPGQGADFWSGYDA